MVVAFSAEALGYYERAQALQSGEVVRQLENTKQLALSSVWVVFGCAALIIGIQRRLRSLRIGALLLLAAATAKAFLVDLRYYDAGWHNLFINPTFSVFALLVAAFALSVWFYARAEDIPERERGALVPVLLGAANLIAIVSLSAEAIGYFSRARAQLGVAQLDDFYRLNNNEQFALSVLWTVYGAVALAIATFRGRKSIRWGALALLVITTAKVLALDTHYYDSAFHTLVFNQTFGAFLFLIGALSCGIWAYSKAEPLGYVERNRLLPIMVTGANLLAIIALSIEALGHYTVLMHVPGLQASRLADLRLAQQLSISVVWTVYGGAMLTFGMARRSRLLRIMGLLLLCLTIFKVFLFDLSSLERLYRIISFIVLGLILLAVSFLYQRYRQRVAELIGEDLEAPAAAE